MNADLTPALIAAGGGSALLAGIWTHEYRTAEAMRKSRVRLGLRFPIGLEPSRAFAALDGLSGLPYTTELIAEVVAGEGSIAHFLWAPTSVRSSVESIMTGVIPSLRVTEAPPSPSEAATLALKVFIPTPSVLSAENAAAASRTLLSGIANLRAGESVVLRLALRPGSARRRREPQDPDAREREIDRAWRHKTSMPGFTTAGLVLIRSPKISRARELASHIESVLRSRKGLAGGVRVTRGRGSRTLASQPRTTRTSGWLSTPELLALTGWPLGPDVAVTGVEVGASRELLVPRHVPREGRRLFIGRDAGGERPVALPADAARLHMAVVAPTGGGKSNLLMRCILDDLAGGYGGVLLDPKNDLVNDLLDRIPPEHASRIVVLDPSASGPVPGLDLLGGGDPDVRADVVLSALRGIYRDAWGVRIDSYLRLGLRTLAELPNPVLSDWMRLYTDAGLRRSAVSRLHDPILSAQWRTYEESLSAAEQFAHIAPALSRITSLLSRPALRAIINQPEPKLSIPRLLAEGRWLLVTLSPSTLGESANDLLSAIVGYLVWTAIEQRVSLPAPQRRPVFFYCDELQSLKLPVGLEVFLERSRGLGCGVVAATQGLARLPESIRQSLLGNVGSLLTFKAGADEATRLARELPGLQAADIMGLARFECAARVSTGSLGSGTAIVTGRTEGPPPLTGQAAAIRALSAMRYGTDPGEVEEELRRRIEGKPTIDEGQLGEIRRAT
jgi:Type IV secretion-system coupling protein DNA-binding domain/Helicase HerA, central domain